ncbi:hypothetical protein [Shewanella aestuarii]|uniref:Uncharacterized protein n=1 Tax=Shewanella aestuarii TaxID=1028752 RepID=A0A6G9QKK1_9GAMM|nr:hypothetical protein [Shewanella aestuarii]QIR14663.1 hypothetical protein HBH39_09345 [Shewanella aestuarii]
MGIGSWFGNNGHQQQALTRAGLVLDNSSTCFMIADPNGLSSMQIKR